MVLLARSVLVVVVVGGKSPCKCRQMLMSEPTEGFIEAEILFCRWLLRAGDID